MIKKGLLITLSTLAIALLCGSAFGYAPVIGNIPDIRIGDLEDKAGAGATIDLNFFRFSNAFNFDKYVSAHAGDTDFATTNVRWSFWEDDGAGNPQEYIDINAKTTLADPADALNPGAKELTNFPNNDPVPLEGRATSKADFWDIQACPNKWLGTYPSAGALTDTVITIYASNGSKVSSEEIMVKSVDGTFDNASYPAPIVIDVVSYLNPASNWTKTDPADGTALDYVGVPYYVATRSTSGNSIVIEDDGTADRNLFGSWESPHGDIDYVANNVYRARFRIHTSQNDTSKVPKIRLFFGSVINIAFGSQQINAGVNAPTVAAKDYWAYYYPPVITGASDTHFKLNFDLVDFTNDQSGNLYLDEVQVQRFEAQAKGSGTSVATFNAAQLNSTWTYSAPGGAYGPVTHGTSGTGLYLESSAVVQGSGGIDNGGWNFGAGGSSTWVANKLYRATFTLQVPDAPTQQTVAKMRIFINNMVNDWIAISQFSISGGFYNHMPSATGTEFSVFCQVPDILYGNDNDKYGYSFDMCDGSDTEQGRCYLTSVEVEYYDIP